MVQMSRLVAAVAVVAGGLTMQSVGASAMPALDTQPARIVQAEGAPGVEQAQFYGRPYGYGYRRPFYGYGYHRHYGYYHRPFFGGYGYRRHFGYGGYGHHRRFGYYGGGYGY